MRRLWLKFKRAPTPVKMVFYVLLAFTLIIVGLSALPYIFIHDPLPPPRF